MCCLDESGKIREEGPVICPAQGNALGRLRGRAKYRRADRRGQALVEFALVSLVIYLLLAAILTFGQILYSAQTLQQAADVASRELARTPLPATADIMDVLYSNDGQFAGVRQSLFDPQLLQFDIATVPAGQSILDAIKTWPIINQMLYPMMIVQPGDQVYGGDQTHEYLVYPGVVPCADSANPNRTVYCVARVDSRQANGAETITWIPVIEEITPGAFSVASQQQGLVSLRINFGCQSATMSAFPPPKTWPPEPDDPPWGAYDDQVTTNASNYTPIGVASLATVGTYGGPYGLGTQEAWAKLTRQGMSPTPPTGVRPFRRLISAQAIYRREVFQ